MILTRRSLIAGFAGLLASTTAHVASASGPNTAVDDFWNNPLTVDEFTVLGPGNVRFSPRAARWAQYVSKVQGFDVTELREAMAKSVLGGYWPYEAPI